MEGERPMIKGTNGNMVERASGIVPGAESAADAALAAPAALAALAAPGMPAKKSIGAPLVATALSALLAASALSGCAGAGSDSSSGAASVETEQAAQTQERQAATLTSSVVKHERYDSAVTELSSDDLALAGYEFGDSVDIVFSNGYTISDVPYFDGYYVKKGSPVLVAYPKDPSVNIAYNNSPLWSVIGLGDSGTVTIALNTPGKYRATFDALSQTYSVERSDYSSDEQFANFRALSGGNLKENFLFRGASPVDNSRNRAAIANALLEANDIVDVLDLADDATNMEKYFASDTFSSYYTRGLYESGADVVLSMASDYDAAAFKESVAVGMRHLIDAGGPAYIHCMEGKDRTGFVCMMIEALAGASYDEMRADYMITYANYYGITADKTPEKYNAIVSLYFDDFASYLYGLGEGTTDPEVDVLRLKAYDYAQAARNYLKVCGMTDGEIDQLVAAITK